ncbi:MAG: DUF1631 family protein [Pseudomonadota bacterium]
MSNAPTKAGKLPVTLTLENAVRLEGQLSALMDGNLQLESVQVLDDPRSQQTLPFPTGTMGSLCPTPGNSTGERLSAVTVSITGSFGDTLTLGVSESQQHLAREYRQLIARGVPAAKQPQTSTPAATAEPASQRGQSSARRSLALSAEYGLLVEDIRQKSLSQLNTALPQYFRDLTEHLIDLSSRMQQGKKHGELNYEAAIEIRNHGSQMAAQFMQQIGAYFDDLVPQQGEDELWEYQSENPTELNVIDEEEFEDFLAIDRIVATGEHTHAEQLKALTGRFAELVDARPEEVRLPVHVRQLCRAYQNGLEKLDIPRAVQPDILEFFAARFLTQLDQFYAPLDTALERAGIEPRSAAQKPKTAASPKPKTETKPPPATEEPARPHSDGTASANAETASGDGLHHQLGEQITGALGRFSPVGLYRSVVDALNFKREAEGMLDGEALESGAELSGTWDGNTVASTELDQSTLADAQSIARALDTLQRNTAARDAVQQADSLRAFLAENREQLGELRNSSGLTAESLNQLDMVDNLFGTIKSQLDVSSELKPSLGNLQIPLAKLALTDARFFVDHGHAARAVIDKLSQLATSANFPNRALEGRINTIVDDIVTGYQDDETVFEEALQKIEGLSAQQERALNRNIERVVRTQEGQEKLARARRAVDRAIGDKLQAPTAPEVLLDLIDSGWRDLLVLTHVKEGPNSSAWSEHLKQFDVLFDWLLHQQAGQEDDKSLQLGLEAEPLIELVEQQITTALPTNLNHEPVLAQLRDILAGSKDVKIADVNSRVVAPEPEPEEVRARIDDLPRLRRWVQRVEQLESGSWLTYRDRTGQKKRMQLAWISPAKDRYIFVNERGQKNADLSAIQLARQLSKGVQPPAPADGLSVVDKSMYHTLEHVQKTLSFTRNHDTLTKLINRETFYDQIGRALRHARLKHSQHAVLYLNIDQFSLVNDVYDRISGDQVLLEFARLLAQLHGKKSSSSRIRDDEFAVLLLDRSVEDALSAAEKIRADIESSSMDIDGENVSFTVSIGVAGILEHSSGVEHIVESARAAMQLAKEKGRNCVMRFEEDQSEAVQYKAEKNRTRRDLEEALATDRFVLRAQPIVQTAVDGTGSTSLHYELLLGLVNKDGSLASPQDFIQSAERYGFMTLVDRWVVKESFGWISKLMDEQKVIPNLSINLSGASVTEDSFMEYLFEQISEFGVGTSKLCFEITETGTISNLVKAADFVRAFRNIGCKFSIDDFGTGLASHNYLRELPVDYVKIDGSFITGIHKNRNDYAMARSINDLAHFLGQETIAESVENEDIVEKLEDIGVDYLQGWGIGRPKVLTEVVQDLSSVET